MPSLLCTDTNLTPHERFFNFQRRSILGISTPSWFCSAETVLVRRHERQNKYKPLVEEANLIYATPQYAHIRFKNGRESTVSLRDVAPVPDSGSSNQSWHETIPPEPEEAIRDGSPPSKNTSIHHEHDTLTPKLPDEEKNLCVENQMMTHQKLRMISTLIKLFQDDQNVYKRHRTN